MGRMRVAFGLLQLLVCCTAAPSRRFSSSRSSSSSSSSRPSLALNYAPPVDLMAPLHADTASLSTRQQTQMLSHWDLDIPPPAPEGVNKVYNPHFTTADAARTWTPYYPSHYVYENVKVTLGPVCGWKYQPNGYYRRVDVCPDDEKTDMRVKMEIKYANYYGTLRGGLRAIGDSPDPSQAPEDPADEKSENLRPFILSVRGDNNTELKWSLQRMEDEWWVNYEFDHPLVGREYYTIVLYYQLQRVLKGTFDKNTFTAHWLRSWSAPLKSMNIIFVFPPSFKVNDFYVEPSDLIGEGDHKVNEEMTIKTSTCCGKEIKDEEEMERCTASNEIARKWVKLEGGCDGKMVMLSTRFGIPQSQLEDSSIDDSIQTQFQQYRVHFSPGLVDDPNAPGANDDAWREPSRGGSFPWWAWLIALMVLAPLLIACFYTFGAYGAHDFFGDSTSQKLREKV
eukprot:747615-Hanusia_phi.AAC.2